MRAADQSWQAIELAGLGQPVGQSGAREALGAGPGLMISVALLVGGVALIMIAVPRFRAAPVGDWLRVREVTRIASGVGATIIGLTLGVLLCLRELGVLAG